MFAEIVKSNFKSLLFATTGVFATVVYALSPKAGLPASTTPAAPPAMTAPAPAYYPQPVGWPAMPTAAPPVTHALPQAVPAQETLTFQVASVGRLASGMVYLNSTPNFRLPGTQSIRVAAGQVADPNIYIGRTVSATGPVKVNSAGNKEVAVAMAPAPR